MKQIETQIFTQMGISQIPKYLFDKDGTLINVYEVNWRKPNQVFHKFSEFQVGILKGTPEPFYASRQPKKCIIEIYTYSKTDRFAQYKFWYEVSTAQEKHKDYQNYILNMLNKQKMSVDVLSDYLSL